MSHSQDTEFINGITDQEDGVEMTRLSNKVLLVARSIGGLLPGLSSEEISRTRDVLELACGPGGWTLSLARAHREMQITGLDTSHSMVAYANTLAQEQELTSVHYEEVPHFLGPFDFPDASFDIVSAQFLSKFLSPNDWPRVLRECVRLLRPGGMMRLTEFEMGMANSPAHEELVSLFILAMMKAGRSFSPTPRHLGLLCELEPLIIDAGFVETRLLSHVVNFSYGADLHVEWKRDFLVLSRLSQPLIVKMGVASQEQVDALHRQQQQEMDLPTFHALLHLLTVWGTRPRECPVA